MSHYLILVILKETGKILDLIPMSLNDYGDINNYEIIRIAKLTKKSMIKYTHGKYEFGQIEYKVQEKVWQDRA